MKKKTDMRLEQFKVEVSHDLGAEVIEVIKTNLFEKGEGTEDNPYRRVTQYWTLDGKLLWTQDPWGGQ